MLGVGRWVKVKTLRLHYVRGEGGGIGRKHYEKYYVFSLFCETKGKKRKKNYVVFSWGGLKEKHYVCTTREGCGVKQQKLTLRSFCTAP